MKDEIENYRQKNAKLNRVGTPCNETKFSFYTILLSNTELDLQIDLTYKI